MNQVPINKQGWFSGWWLGWSLLCLLVGLGWLGMFPMSKRYAERLDKQAEERLEKQKPRTLEEEAVRLRKNHNSVHIYAVSNRFEVWCTHGLEKGKWRDAETLEDARRVVSEYYLEWARNCMGPVPNGKLVE